MRALLSHLFAWSTRSSQQLWWRSRMLRALLWPLFAFTARAQPATVVAYTKVEGAALASVLLVGVGSASHCGGWDNR
jgi:hypothetical protein